MKPLTPAQQTLATGAVGYIEGMARAWCWRRDVDPSLHDDAVGVALEALCEAVPKWDPEGGASLTSYATWAARQRLADWYWNEGVVRGPSTFLRRQGRTERVRTTSIDHVPPPSVDPPTTDRVDAERIYLWVAGLTQPHEAREWAGVYSGQSRPVDHARARGVSRQAVDQSIRRTMAKVREQLGLEAA